MIPAPDDPKAPEPVQPALFGLNDDAPADSAFNTEPLDESIPDETRDDPYFNEDASDLALLDDNVGDGITEDADDPPDEDNDTSYYPVDVAF